MSERKLSDDQKARIDAIVDKWEKEREQEQKNIPVSKIRTLDGERTRINLRLEKKYMPMIQAIMEE